MITNFSLIVVLDVVFIRNGGDVHISTLDGALFTFSAAGDYKFLDSKPLEIHTRAIKTSDEACMTLPRKISLFPLTDNPNLSWT